MVIEVGGKEEDISLPFEHDACISVTIDTTSPLLFLHECAREPNKRYWQKQYIDMRPLTDDEAKLVFEKLGK